MLSNSYDVVICGGGLAAQTLARQLKLSMPGLSVLMIVKTALPLAPNDFKVGESTVEISAFYLSEVLQLESYFRNNHFVKFGFRYFIGDGRGDLAQRPEIGLTRYAPYNSFQIDRSVLENDLYEMNRLACVEIITNATVKTVTLNAAGMHTVSYEHGNRAVLNEVLGKWVIDATGRRCLLQRQLGLQIPQPVSYSAIWWRVKGRLDIDDMVVPENRAFHLRVPYGSRYFSTVHLMNKGYWVWLIPLASGNTSVGIVAANSIYPFETYHTPELSMKWLQEHEPVLHAHMQGFEMLDFLKMKHYSYDSKQVFSSDRWACIGDAAVFTDPFYSPGCNFIAFENSMITHMLRNDLAGQQDWTGWVAGYNDFILGMNRWLTASIQSSYTYFHLDIIMALSFMWDVAAGWSFIAPRMFSGVFLDAEKMEQLKPVSLKFFALAYTIEQFFNEWKQLTRNTYTFGFIEYLNIPFLKNIYERNIKRDKPSGELQADYTQNLRELEIFVQAIFRLALEDVYPELPVNGSWINAWAITLNREKWKSCGLFEPDTVPADITPLFQQLKAIFRPRQDGSKAATAHPVEDALDFGF